jgi:NADH-quinone oxidoreductase subunit L
MIFLTFFGKNRAKEDVQHHIHESPWTMLLPLVVLAFFALFGGALYSGSFVGEEHALEHLGIRNVPFNNEEVAESAHGLNLALTLLAAVGGIALAYLTFGKGQNVPDPDANKNPFYRASLNKFYIDEIYDCAIVFPFRIGSELLHWLLDVLFIDGLITGLGYLVVWMAGWLRRIQTGVLNCYALGILSGTLVLLMYFFTHWK